MHGSWAGRTRLSSSAPYWMRWAIIRDSSAAVPTVDTRRPPTWPGRVTNTRDVRCPRTLERLSYAGGFGTRSRFPSGPSRRPRPARVRGDDRQARAQTGPSIEGEPENGDRCGPVQPRPEGGRDAGRPANTSAESGRAAMTQQQRHRAPGRRQQHEGQCPVATTTDQGGRRGVAEAVGIGTR